MACHIVIDATGFPSAGSYYQRCTHEPLKPNGAQIQLGQRFPIQNLTFDRLLQQIVDSVPASGGSVLQVHHGTHQGIVLGLVPGASAAAGSGASVSALDLLSSSMASDSSAATSLGISEQDVGRLRGLRDAVREKHLQRVIIRGCLLGQWSETLRAIKRFYGAAAVEAPTVYNAYGSGSVNVHSADFDFGTLEHVYEVNGGGRVGFDLDANYQTLTLTIRNWRSTNSAALTTWLGAKFPFQNPAAMQHSSVVIYLQDNGREAITLPREGGYRANLAEFTGSAGSSLDDL